MVFRVKARARMRIGSNVVEGRKAVVLQQGEKKEGIVKVKSRFSDSFRM
jgi:hypothetical protein